MADEIKDLGGGEGSLDADLAALRQQGGAAAKDDAKDLSAGSEMSLDEAIARATAEGLSRRDADVGGGNDPLLMDVDLDRVQAAADARDARDLAGREDMLAATNAEVYARVQARMRDEQADSAYDESVMGGVYVGAAVGAIIGLAIFRFDLAHKLGAALGASVGLALVGGLVGWGIGMAAGAGARAAVRSDRAGQRVMASLGILLLAAPLATVLIAGVKWGLAEYLWITLGALILVAFGLFVWAFQDAGYRGMGGSSAIGWGLISAVFPPAVGLYMGKRPKGELTPCSRCEKKHLAVLERCPHCGYVRKAGARSQEDLDLNAV